MSAARRLGLLAPALAAARAEPSACEHDDEPALALGLASTGDFTPLVDGATLPISRAPQGGSGLPVRVRTRGLLASNDATATVTLSLTLAGMPAGTFTLEGYPLLCEGSDVGGSLGVQVVPIDPDRYATEAQLMELDGAAAEISIEAVDDDGRKAEASAAVVLAYDG